MPAARPPVEPPAWHADGQALARVVGDLLADELARLRPGAPPLPLPPWPAELQLGPEGLGLDSLERLNLASALNEALHLHESGLEDLLLVHTGLADWLAVAHEALLAFDARLSFATSGSSGTPKVCEHALATLAEEADHLASLLPGRQRLLSAVPAHHIYGFLFTVLLPGRLQPGGVVPVIDIRRHTPQALRRLLQPGDLLVSHPAHWALLARHGLGDTPDVVGTSSTAPCPDELHSRLRDQGLARLVQVYGSSETAGVGWRDAPGQPFQAMPWWQPDAQDPHTLWRLPLEDGSPVAHAAPDQLHWHSAQQFSVLGRHDGAVQVAGTNVFPERVRQLLLTHPEVADAAVRRMSEAEGQRLKAFIVPAAGADWAALQAALWDWSAARLSAPEAPKAFTLGTALPRNALGKLADWPLGAPAGQG